MPLGSGKTEALAALKTINEYQEKQIAELKEERAELKEQIKNLQDALIALKDNKSYEMLQADRASLSWEQQSIEDQIKEHSSSEEYQAFQAFQREQEGPLFKNANDFARMIEDVALAQGAPESAPLHENEES